MLRLYSTGTSVSSASDVSWYKLSVTYNIFITLLLLRFPLPPLEKWQASLTDMNNASSSKQLFGTTGGRHPELFQKVQALETDPDPQVFVRGGKQQRRNATLRLSFQPVLTMLITGKGPRWSFRLYPRFCSLRQKLLRPRRIVRVQPPPTPRPSSRPERPSRPEKQRKTPIETKLVRERRK